MYTLGSGGGVRMGGVQVSDYSMCMLRRWRGGGEALCVVEGVGLVAAAVGWRMSSWLDDTGVFCVLAGCIGLLSICKRQSNGLSCVFKYCCLSTRKEEMEYIASVLT